MTPDEILHALESRGWEVEVVEQGRVADLVDVDAEGLMKCVDGRPSDHRGMRGPKALGGIYAIASLRGINTLEGLTKVVAEVREAGYLPSVHGDGHAHPGSMGCGYFKLWASNALDGLEPPTYTSEEGRAAVIEAGGVYETLAGAHSESIVMVNLVPNTTLEPKAHDQRFVVDGWVAATFDLHVPSYLTLAAQTVELLGGPKIARIIVP